MPDSHENEGGLWREFVSIELDNGITFDPVRYLTAARDFEQSPVEGLSWEELYQQDPALLGWDILSCVTHAHDKEEREVFFVSALRIAETLPNEPGEYATYGALAEAIFWKRFDYANYDHCNELYRLLKSLHRSSESMYWIKEMLKDPEAYKQRLDEGNETEN